MSTIPKAIIHVNTSFAVEPTEEQLLTFFKDYGYNTMDEIFQNFGGGFWDEVIREWFINTYQVTADTEFNRTNNILTYESDSEDEKVVLIKESEWDSLKDNDLIY